MNRPKNTISRKIELLNKATIYPILETNKVKIIENFTNTALNILEADFGFAWLKVEENKEYKLAYKSPNIPFPPMIPKRKNHEDKKLKKTLFDNNVKKGEYEDNLDRYIKSYIIIPLRYGDHIHGSIVVCYKQQHNFTKEELELSHTIGNIGAQALNLHWLLENQYDSLALGEKQKQSEITMAEKQKEIEVLLYQEKLKTEFIANTTHEFRTPLAIMRGHVDLALRRGRNELKETRKALRVVNTEIIHLAEMISDLVLIISGRNINNTKQFNLIDITNLLQDTVDRLRNLAKENNISIAIKSGAKNISVMGDKKHLERLFLNLIKNAITYGKSKINIEISKSKGKVVVKIKDNGIGIAKEDLPNIFERFYRADKSHSSYGKHSGLGLAIVKWITEIHKGKIEVESTRGKGSTFTVTLPEKNSMPN